MEGKVAIEYLTAPKGKKPSEIGEAVDTLYQEYHSYKAISQQLGISPKFLSKRHCISQLPKGIQWKIDEEYIGIDKGYQIYRLKKENDQWLLAFTIIEEKLSTKECEDVVNAMLKQNCSLEEALGTSIGVRFDKIQTLLLPVGFDIRLAICRAAWSQRENWEDLCYRLIRQGLDVDIQGVANQLRALAADLQEAGSKEGSARKEAESSSY